MNAPATMDKPTTPTIAPLPPDVSLAGVIKVCKEELAILTNIRDQGAADKAKTAHRDHKLHALICNLRILLFLQYWMGPERMPGEVNFVLGELLKFPAPCADLTALLARIPGATGETDGGQLELVGDGS